MNILQTEGRYQWRSSHGHIIPREKEVRNVHVAPAGPLWINAWHRAEGRTPLAWGAETPRPREGADMDSRDIGGLRAMS
jgi:hypothetical protein